MRIPLDSLKPDTLRNVVAEFVTRDGTELTDAEVMIEQVLRRLRDGYAELHFDEETGTTSIVPTTKP